MRWVIEYDCGKSIYMNDVFILYYWGGDNDCYYLTKRVFVNLVKKLQAEPKPKIRINKKKLEGIRKDFYEVRH